MGKAVGIQKGNMKVWGHRVRNENGEEGKERGWVGRRVQDKAGGMNRRVWSLGDTVE